MKQEATKQKLKGGSLSFSIAYTQEPHEEEGFWSIDISKTKNFQRLLEKLQVEGELVTTENYSRPLYKGYFLSGLGRVDCERLFPLLSLTQKVKLRVGTYIEVQRLIGKLHAFSKILGEALALEANEKITGKVIFTPMRGGESK